MLDIMLRREEVGETYITIIQIVSILYPDVDLHVDFGEYARRYQGTRLSMVALERRGLVERVARLKGGEIGWATFNQGA